MALRDDLADAILAIEGVVLKRSRFSEAPALYANGREIAHFHGGNEIDIRLTKARIRALKSDLEADRRVALRKGSDWVAFRFRRRIDLARAVDLVRDAAEGSSL